MDRKYIHLNICKQQIYIVFFTALLFGFSPDLLSQSAENTMKAVAFEKISLFISWPTDAFKNQSSPEFIIGVLSQNPLSEVLKEVYKDKKIKDRKVKIVIITNLQELAECHMLFIPKIKTSELSKVLNFIKGKPILTISDSEGFAEAGCLINFYEYEKKLRFEINQQGMKDAGFAIDYRLLKVSKVLNPVLE
jgi:hypothetical protein